MFLQQRHPSEQWGVGRRQKQGRPEIKAGKHAKDRDKKKRKEHLTHTIEKETLNMFVTLNGDVTQRGRKGSAGFFERAVQASVSLRAESSIQDSTISMGVPLEVEKASLLSPSQCSRHHAGLQDQLLFRPLYSFCILTLLLKVWLPKPLCLWQNCFYIGLSVQEPLQIWGSWTRKDAQFTPGTSRAS